MAKQILGILKWLAILIIIFGVAFLIYLSVKISQPLKTQGEEKSFSIPSGTSTKQVAASLEREDLISRALFFELYIYFKHQGSKIKAGNYVLSSDMSIREIAGVLTAGDVINNQIKFTIIEGWTLADISKALRDAGILESPSIDFSPQEFAGDFPYLADQIRNYASLEGYLFPDTYFIAKDAAPDEIAKKMLANFDRKLTAEMRNKIEKNGRNIHETVIMASIVEKEVGRNLKKGTKLGEGEIKTMAEERRLVAGVFYNRLKIGMALNSDATIGYITGSNVSRATLEETKIDSPYNTYKYPGLPPGPISNPSLDALAAAIEPADTDYLYFVTDPAGKAYFAETFEEHQVNRAKYLQ